MTNQRETFDSKLAVGQVVRVRWTWSYGQYDAEAEIVKLNAKSVRVKLLQDAGDHFTSGFVLTVKRGAESYSINNGVFPVSEVSQ